jgi:hypothetical protein
MSKNSNTARQQHVQTPAEANQKQAEVEQTATTANATTTAQPATEAPKIPGLPANFDREAFLKQHNGNKSAAIRALRAMGMEVGPIAKALILKYQHVRNVLIQQLGAKVAPVATPAPEKTDA